MQFEADIVEDSFFEADLTFIRPKRAVFMLTTSNMHLHKTTYSGGDGGGLSSFRVL